MKNSILNNNLSEFLNHLKNDAASEKFIEWCSDSYLDWIENTNKTVALDDVETISKHDIPNLESISCEQTIKLGIENLNKVAVLKLNGGLGTSMGCLGPKSLIKIDKEETFLDKIAKQIKVINKNYSCSIPLVLMNSFYTNTETLNYLKSKNIGAKTFLQDRLPRLDAKNKTIFKLNNQIDWCPPGHGNCYLSLVHSGLLDELISEGKDYVFISNSDNIGASLDPIILGYMIKSKKEFLMEVASRTKQDIKGGTIVRNKDEIMLLERAQINKPELGEFESTSRFKLFNTNNIWVHLPTLKTLVEEKKLLMSLIINQKRINNRDVVQFESAIGSAIGSFEKSCILCVPRRRFLPVKLTSDLLLIQSHLFEKNKDGSVIKKDSTQELPLITFDAMNLNLNHYLTHFKIIPTLDSLTSLHIEGAFEFNENVSLSGNVKFINKSSNTIELKNKSIHNKTVAY